MPPTCTSLLLALTAVTVASASAVRTEGPKNCPGEVLKCFLLPTLSSDLENRTSTVAGSLTFTPHGVCDGVCGTRITGTITGLGDAAPHGWHVHALGDVSATDGTATGGHFNPAGVDHGLPGAPRHVGDLGNLMPNEYGTAVLSELAEFETMTVVGRGLIVHAKEDDGGQPTGNAGARLAQCVLGIGKAEE